MYYFMISAFLTKEKMEKYYTSIINIFTRFLSRDRSATMLDLNSICRSKLMVLPTNRGTGRKKLIENVSSATPFTSTHSICIHGMLVLVTDLDLSLDSKSADLVPSY